MADVRDREQIKNQVLVRADEFSLAADDIGGDTALEAPIETIEDELDLAALYVVRNARLDLLFPLSEGNLKHFHDKDQLGYVNDVDTRISVRSATDLSGVIPCPHLFQRFVSLKLTSWKKEVRDLMPYGGQAYLDERDNKYSGGSKYKPKAALAPFTGYETKLTGTLSNPFTVGEKVTGSGGATGHTPATGIVKESGAGFIKLKDVQGSFDLSGGRGSTIGTGGTSGETITSITAIQDEYNRYKVIKKTAFNVSTPTTNLVNLSTIESLILNTGDFVSLPFQNTASENGIWRVGASTGAQLTKDIITKNKGQAIEFFRADTANDSIESFQWIREHKPEEMPGEILDMMIDEGAYRILKFMGRFEAAKLARASADHLMGLQKV